MQDNTSINRLNQGRRDSSATLFDTVLEDQETGKATTNKAKAPNSVHDYIHEWLQALWDPTLSEKQSVDSSPTSLPDESSNSIIANLSEEMAPASHPAGIVTKCGPELPPSAGLGMTDASQSHRSVSVSYFTKSLKRRIRPQGPLVAPSSPSQETTRAVTHDKDNTSRISNFSATTHGSETGFKSPGISHGAPSAASASITAPVELLMMLAAEIFENLEVRKICIRILDIEGEPSTIRILGLAMKRYCTDLSCKGPNKLQEISIQLLYRYRLLFAQRACQAYMTSDGQYREGPIDLSEEKLSMEAKRKKHLRENYRGKFSKAKVGPPRDLTKRDDSEMDWFDESSDSESASEILTDNVEGLSSILTEATLVWLTKGLPFQNFKNNLASLVYPPMEYINSILEAAYPTTNTCRTSFTLQWGLSAYIESEMSEGQSLATMLTLSGDGDTAYAVSCLEYCS